MRSLVPLPPAAEGFTRIDGFEDIDAVLRSRSVAVVAARFPVEFAGDTLVTMDGDEHSRRRRIEMPSFEPKALNEYEHTVLRPTAAHFLDELFEQAEAGQDHVSFDLVDFGRSMLVRLGAMIAGIDGVETPEAARRLYSLVERMARGLNVVWVKGDQAETDRVLAEAKAAQDAFKVEFFTPSQVRRLAAMHSGGELDTDVLTSILRQLDPDWDPGLPMREVFLYLSASIDTSTRVLCHAVDEVLRWQQRHPSESIYEADPEFVHAAAQETLRLHPALPAIMRVATADFVLPSGQQIMAGEHLALTFGTANRDVNVFGDDAEEFVPARALRLSTMRSHGFAFGGGPHTCIGRRLAAGGVASGDTVTQGTVGTLLGELLAAGITSDHDAVPVRSEATYHDAFDIYPVRVRARSSSVT